MDRSNVQGFPLSGKEGDPGGTPPIPLMPKIPKIYLLLDTPLTKTLSPPFPTCTLKEYILEKNGDKQLLGKFYPQFQEHYTDLFENIHLK